ncbi:MAG: Gldg family protein [Marvinbryantia sp.]|uniref:Gldg family protein n=1 Tax=Marvinbryantia sp. TaxID=2496532 RepID=UPI00399A8AE2
MKLKAIKLEKERRLTKHGSYSLALTAVVIAAAVVVNLIVSELPSKYTQIDLTSAQLSVLTEQSEELLDSLTEDITIYYVVQDSNRDTNVSRLLERYAGASGHIKLVEKDPVRYPKFTAQYTDASLTENSVIIECGEQSRVINYEDMYESEFDYEYYSYEMTGFDAEGQITSAIAALSSGNLPKVYMLTGHNEMTVGTSLQSSIEKENVETAELNLISEERVPEDADAVMILSPQLDLTDAETQKLFRYLKTGGRAVIVTDYTDVEMPNLESVLEYYGMEKAEGVVLESDNGHYVQVPYYLLPEVESTEISEDLTGSYVLLAAAQGLTVSDDTGDVSLGTVLDELEIADDAAEEEAGMEEETDAAESSSEGETETAETRVAVFTSSSLLDESANQMVSGGNYRLFVNTVSWLCGNETTVSIPVKNISAEYLMVPAASASFWSIVMIGIIPAGFLLTGLYTWLKRRRQ